MSYERDIMFYDLKDEVQEEIAEELGFSSATECMKENNWDIIPMLVFEHYDDDEDDDDEDNDNE
jgi:hypothetical protein